MQLHRTLLVAGLSLSPTATGAQQVPDTAFVPRVGAPAYASGEGPRVVIDGAHANFHTVDGRYSPFAKLVSRDGYRVSGSREPFSDAMLASVDVLVIANALNARNANDNWVLPTPSAFTDDEITAVRKWVNAGGALLLIADHMPFGGAAENLGAAFGIQWLNGFAFDARQNGNYRYSRSEGIHRHPIFSGRAGKSERVDSLVAFTGSAFWIPEANGSAPLLTVPADTRVVMPRVAWQFGDSVASLPGKGLLQAAALRVAKGRIVAAGEAAMFSAQRAGAQGENLMGFNAPTAPQNAQFALNVLHWLSGLLPAR